MKAMEGIRFYTNVIKDAKELLRGSEQELKKLAREINEYEREKQKWNPGTRHRLKAEQKLEDLARKQNGQDRYYDWLKDRLEDHRKCLAKNLTIFYSLNHLDPNPFSTQLYYNTAPPSERSGRYNTEVSPINA